MTKNCKFCNAKLKQRENEFDIHFEARQYCNRSCATKDMWKKRKK